MNSPSSRPAPTTIRGPRARRTVLGALCVLLVAIGLPAVLAQPA